MSDVHGLALIGGRGYTGSSLLPLIDQHPHLELVCATSSTGAGEPIRSIDANWSKPEQCLRSLVPSEVSSVEADVWVLALPNGASAAWVEAIEKAHPQSLIVDFGADYRLDADSGFVYGLSEWQREALAGAKRIANPGCYATAAQLGLKPLAPLIAAPPIVFGISGYSGAGKTPSPRNDPKRLADNLIPYQLTGHVHEQEISHHLGQSVCFHPHVAPFFRGLSVTCHVQLQSAFGLDPLYDMLEKAYAQAPLVVVQDEIPQIREVANTPRAHIGGICIDERDGHHVSFVVVLDNLLKGASSQAIQNINIALGFHECEGLGVL